MNLGAFLMRVHAAIAAKVLGKKLVEKAKACHEAAEERRVRLVKKADDLIDITQEICRDSGLVTNGSHKETP